MEIDLFNIRIWRVNIAWEQRLFGCRHRYYQEGIRKSKLYLYIGHLFIGVNMYYTRSWPFFSFNWHGDTFFVKNYYGISLYSRYFSIHFWWRHKAWRWHIKKAWWLIGPLEISVGDIGD